MHSNSSDIAVVDAMDCCSDGGGSTQLRPDQCGGDVIGAAATGSARWRHGSGAGAVGRCEGGVLTRRDDDGGVNDGGSGAVWEASAGGDPMESFDPLMT
jgi:hypothetical protein